jgi:hypothetical protein
MGTELAVVLRYKDMETISGKNTQAVAVPEPVGTSSNPQAAWITVQDAVAYCLSKGLHRTPKTVRKWALRSQNAEAGSAEVIAKAQDTENGFRWLIERASLDVKIAQELDFEARKNAEGTEPNLFAPVVTGAGQSPEVPANQTQDAPVPTGSHLSAHVHPDNTTVSDASTSPHPSEQVPIGAHRSTEQMIEFLMKQIDTKDQQLAVKDRQIESMLERDHETNILIQGLQTSLTGVVQALPNARREDRQHRDFGHRDVGDKSQTQEPRVAIQ